MRILADIQLINSTLFQRFHATLANSITSIGHSTSQWNIYSNVCFDSFIRYVTVIFLIKISKQMRNIHRIFGWVLKLTAFAAVANYFDIFDLTWMMWRKIFGMKIYAMKNWKCVWKWFSQWVISHMNDSFDSLTTHRHCILPHIWIIRSVDRNLQWLTNQYNKLVQKLQWQK